ncbi:MAG TPA: HAMP domain-containing methyl-accepting chemotaxis protein [Aliidongia sp.]|uniref:methyl-accepting chemotaxis protein n=1 Tax=Aliidongia sp. TaxID=1914230 RepID=UPI002DDC94A6|nr:HAMP domain-containing methyl-accepting chemotaxis protein [Aliidongia sp.]HEV2677592.1 HAMP domain-containing methyl-accepting chemotaxis protein [Aliidongia sp.]
MSLGLRLRVGSLLTAAFVALSALLVIVLGLQVVTAIRETSEASRLVTLAEADRTVFGSMQALRVSRGDIQTALLNLDDPKPKLAEVRARDANEFQAAVRVLPRIGGAGLDRLTVELQQRWSAVGQLWDQLDAYAAKPKAERDIKATEAWYKGLGAVIDSLNEASLNVAGEARIADPFVGELVGARQTAWGIRDAAGSECSASRGAVAGGKKLSADVRAGVDRLRGSGEAGWTSLKGLMVRPGVPSALRGALAEADAAMGKSIAERDAVYRKLDDSGTAPVTPGQWTTLCNAPFEPILKIALTALDLMQRRAEDQRASARFSLAASSAVLLLALAGAAFVLRLIRRRVVTPVRSLSAAIGHLSRRDYAQPVPLVGQDDEFAEMAVTLEALRQGALDADRLAAERLGAQEADLARAGRLGLLCRGFETSVGRTLDAVGQATGRMIDAAGAMTGTAGDATQRTEEIARAVQQAAESINAVAGAAEEMRASLSEVSDKVEQSSRLTARAVGDAEATNREVAQLSDAAAQIGQVVGVISAIAAQTNLLALNATIEAARAGEAGKGFAVVASEVKNLASQTAAATEQITRQVAAIQQATETAVQAIGGIGARIREVDGLTGAITQAVQGQVSAMNQVARDAQDVATVTGRVSSQLDEVRTAAAETGVAAGQVRQTADDLSHQSTALNREVEQFIAGVQTA